MGRESKPRWNPSGTSAENAKRVLSWLAAQFFESGRNTVGVSPTARSLHKLRLRGKRLRYSLELFAPCYGPGLDHRLSELKKVQNYLGEISDCDATIRLIRGLQLEDDANAVRLNDFLTARKKDRIERFVDHWRTYFDAPGQLESWLFYLKNYAGRVSPPSARAAGDGG